MLASSALGASPLHRGLFGLAWKHLLQNQAHDSICGCSVDRVHRDMVYRYDQASDLCAEIRGDFILGDLAAISGEDPRTEAFYKEARGSGIVLRVFNPLPFETTRVLDLDIDFPPDYPRSFAEPFGYQKKPAFRLLSEGGGRTAVPPPRPPPQREEAALQSIRGDRRRRDLRRQGRSAPLGLDEHPRRTCGDRPAASRRPAHGALGGEQRDPNPGPAAGRELHGQGPADRSPSFGLQPLRLRRGDRGRMVPRHSPGIRPRLQLRGERAAGRGEFPRPHSLHDRDQSGSPLRAPLAGKPRRRLLGRRGLGREMQHTDFDEAVPRASGSDSIGMRVEVDNEGAGPSAQDARPRPGHGRIPRLPVLWFRREEARQILRGRDEGLEGTRARREEISGEPWFWRTGAGGGFCVFSACGLHEVGSYPDSSVYLTLLRSFRRTVMTNGEEDGQVQGRHSFSLALFFPRGRRRHRRDTEELLRLLDRAAVLFDGPFPKGETDRGEPPVDIRPRDQLPHASSSPRTASPAA